MAYRLVVHSYGLRAYGHRHEGWRHRYCRACNFFRRVEAEGED